MQPQPLTTARDLGRQSNQDDSPALDGTVCARCSLVAATRRLALIAMRCSHRRTLILIDFTVNVPLRPQDSSYIRIVECGLTGFTFYRYSVLRYLGFLCFVFDLQNPRPISV